MSRDPRDVNDVFTRGGWERGPMPPPDPSRIFTVELPAAGAPPLILVSDRTLSSTAIANVRESLRLAVESRVPLLMSERGFTYFQLVDGRWQPLKANP